MTTAQLVQKYNVPVPRYTSYPTVPAWSGELDKHRWMELAKLAFRNFGKKEGITLYIHLPYCESLCTYCGCNKRITKNHKVETPYIEALLTEWQNYLKAFGSTPKLAGIHLGGGTPTFFSPEALEQLISIIRATSHVPHDAEFSFEGHPNNTTVTHLKTLFDLGFRRVSYGIQDFNLTVQKAIHRIQPFEKVKEVTLKAREIGYTSINFDLIYGLPHQSIATIRETFERVSALKPDRIAFYSYAHLPSAFPSQRSFEQYLPNEQEKRGLYDVGKEILSEMGYAEIGMDHFALSSDPLMLAKQNKTLHRNFMGYTTLPTKMLIGLGNTAISDIYYAYGQNEKDINTYKELVTSGCSAIAKGHQLSKEDLSVREIIRNLICNLEVSWDFQFFKIMSAEIKDRLRIFMEEGIVEYDHQKLKITEKGRPFVRNVCSILDRYKPSTTTAFSKSI